MHTFLGHFLDGKSASEPLTIANSVLIFKVKFVHNLNNVTDRKARLLTPFF